MDTQKSAIIDLLTEAKKLYNEYGAVKNSPTIAGRELALGSTTAAFLRQCLALGQEFLKNTECETEREALRLFAGELQRVFK